MKFLLFLLSVLVLTGAAVSPQGPSQEEIDKAIEKGANYLVGKFPNGVPTNNLEFELVIYTLIHAELNPHKVNTLKKGIEDLINLSYPVHDQKKGTTDKITYRIAARCLALHSLLVKINRSNYFKSLYKDRVKTIQKKIAESAQYLVDTQLDNGQWTYAGVKKHDPVVTNLSTGAPPEESKFNKTASKEAWENASNLTGTLYKLIPKYGADPKNKGTDLGQPVSLGKQRGDNSNAQYAVLGLIAAEMSGVEVPRTTWELAKRWFESDQNSDGGFDYGETGGPAGTTSKAPKAPQGAKKSYGSMTTAGAVALAAAYKYTGHDYRSEAKFRSAVQWIAGNFSVTANPRASSDPVIPQTANMYFLYGLERVGAFSGLDKFGGHDWYAEGATHLLKVQKGDGSWMIEPKANSRGMDFTICYDTCFAILFLKKATVEMIDSGARGGNNNDPQ